MSKKKLDKEYKNFIILEYFLVILLVLNFILIIGKIFNLNNCLNIKWLTNIWIELNNNLEYSLLKYLFISFSALLTLLILSVRNRQLEKQSNTQYKMFMGNSEFNNFLEATKLLTNSASTIEAKISALYLLNDVAQNHSQNIDRIIQVLNKQLIPLIKCLENDCSSRQYDKKIINKELKKNSLKYKTIYEYKKKDLLNIDYNDFNFQKTILEWKYKGNDTEKIIATTLEVLKKIVLEIVLKEKNNIDLSNTILFDIDTDFNKYLNFQSKKKSTRNIIFLSSKLKGTDFSNVIYHFVKFINCDLISNNLENANLWGSDFINCDLKNTNFKNCECEGVSFINCKNLTIKQIKDMKFKFNEQKLIKNKKDIGKYFDIENIDKELIDKYLDEKFYPIVIDDKTKKTIKDDIKLFENIDEYQQFIKIKNIIYEFIWS